MNKNFSLKFRVFDVIIIVASVLISGGFMAGILIHNKAQDSGARYVNVYHDNALLQKYTTRLDTLNEQKKVVLEKEEYPDLLGDFTILMDKNKGIKVTNITCTDHTCEKQKWVNIDNLPIICIPNDVRVEIVSSLVSGGDEVIGACYYEHI